MPDNDLELLFKDYPELEKYYKYFKDDLSAIEEELAKSKNYSAIIDKQLEDLGRSNYSSGSQRYLIDHIENAVQLQSQRQSLRKDRFNIKKVIMDYSNRENAGNSEEASLIEVVKDLMRVQKNNIQSNTESHSQQNDEDLDSEIDNILGSAE